MRRLRFVGLMLMCWPAVAAAETPTIFAPREIHVAQASPVPTPTPNPTATSTGRPALTNYYAPPGKAAPPIATPNDPPPSRMAMGELTPTPSMWFYEQERRRYEDPRTSVRVNAEQRGIQRRQRMAALQWFGYSNARPVRSTTPFNGTSSPQWGSNSADPSVWSGVGNRPTIVLAPEATYLR